MEDGIEHLINGYQKGTLNHDQTKEVFDSLLEERKSLLVILSDFLKKEANYKTQIRKLTNENEALHKDVKSLKDYELRTGVLTYVFHKAQDTLLLEEKCGLIKKGLGDELDETVTKGQKFTIEKVAVYTLEKDVLKLRASKGDFPGEIWKDRPNNYFHVWHYREHVHNLPVEGVHPEILVTLIANKVYQGVIVLQDSEGITASKELAKFLHDYGDMAAGAVFSGLAHQRLEQITNDIKKWGEDTVHDFKTPVDTIIGYMNRLKKKTLDLDKMLSEANIVQNFNDLIRYHIDYYKIILVIAQDLSLSANNILDISRKEAGYDVKIVEYDLHKRIDTIKTSYQYHLEEKNMDILCSFDSQTEIVKTDGNLVGAIITNLLSNAVKYGNKDSKIELGAKITGNMLNIYCVDEGDANIEKIMEHKNYVGEQGGHGRGTKILFDNAELLGGNFNISKFEKEGVNYVKAEVYLPLR